MLASFLQLLDGKPPSETIWTADLSYWIAGQRHAGRSDPGWDAEEGYLRLCRDLGLMPYYWYDQFWLGEPAYDSTVQTRVEQRNGVTTRVWSTPAGVLRQEFTFLPASCSTGCTRYPVQTESDLAALACLIEHRHLVPSCLDDYERRRALWARYDGLPSIALPRSPLAAFLYEWAGVQAGVYLLVDHPEQVARILALMEEQESPILDAVCAAAPPLVHFADNLSSDNLAGLYDRHMAPAHRHRLARLHAAGVKAAVHLDGQVRGLLPRLAAAGFDAIEALTPQPAGDVAVEDLRAAAANDRVILWGGLPGVMFAPPFTWADMALHVRRLLSAWRGTRFVIGVADQIPPDGDITFCRRISELIRLSD